MSWIVIFLAALVLGGLVAFLAQRKRRQFITWFLLGAGAFLLGAVFTGILIPTLPEEGALPDKWQILWVNPAFRSDMLLVILSTILIIGFIILFRRWSRVQTEDVPFWNRALAILFFALPVILWLVAIAIWVRDDPSHVTAGLLLIAGLVIPALIQMRLDGRAKAIGLLIVAVVLVGAQFLYNAGQEPPESIFDPPNTAPIYLPLLLVLLGYVAGGIMRKFLPSRRYTPMFWQLGALAWVTAVLAFFLQYLGEYEFGASVTFELVVLMTAPLQALIQVVSTLYYSVIPREIDPAQQVAQAQQIRLIFQLLGGLGVWAFVWLEVRHISPLAHMPSFGESLQGMLRPRALSLNQRRYLLAVVLITPAILLRGFTTLYPFVETLLLSVEKYNPAFPPRTYVGLQNFERLASDLVVRESLQFTLLFVILSTLFQVVLGLAIAHLLNVNFRFRGFSRMISLIPWAIPMVVVGIAARWLFDDDFGMIPDMAARIFGVQTSWLIDPNVAQVAVITVNIWKSLPFVALVLLAGMQGIPGDLYEAAKVDGANWIGQLRYITVPMLLPIIVTISMFMLIWQLATFDLPFTMTGGGPGFSTTVLAQKIYLEINSLNYSFAAAIGVLLLGLVAVIGGVGMYIFRRVEVSQ